MECFDDSNDKLKEECKDINANTFMSKVVENYQNDTYWSPILEKLKGKVITQERRYSLQNDGSIYTMEKKPRLCIPQNNVILNYIFKKYHDDFGHFGIEKTYYSLINTKYYWPNSWNFVKDYLQTCDSCQKTKSRQQENSRIITTFGHSE